MGDFLVAVETGEGFFAIGPLLIGNWNEVNLNNFAERVKKSRINK